MNLTHIERISNRAHAIGGRRKRDRYGGDVEECENKCEGIGEAHISVIEDERRQVLIYFDSTMNQRPTTHIYISEQQQQVLGDINRLGLLCTAKHYV